MKNVFFAIYYSLLSVVILSLTIYIFKQDALVGASITILYVVSSLLSIHGHRIMEYFVSP